MNLVDKLLERYQDAKTCRSKYEGTLTEIGRYVWPNMQDVTHEAYTDNNELVRTVDIHDSTAIVAAARMTSGIMGNMMPIGLKWFEFAAKDEAMNNDFTVKRWLSNATTAVHKVLWQSNFISQMTNTIRSMITFTIGCIAMERIGDKFAFNSYHMRDIFFQKNSKGEVDTEFRRIFYTARQAKQEYGDKISKSIQEALKSNSTQKFEFVHIIWPNEDYDEKIGSKKFASKIIAVADKAVVKEGGYDSLPYKVVFYSENPDSEMGYSPAVEILPEVKMLNAERRTFWISSEMLAQPPMIYEDDGVVGQPVTSPGGAIVIRSGAMVPAPYKTGANPQLTLEVIKESRQIVREHFLNDVFDALKYYRRETAAELKEIEIRQKIEEGFVVLAPIVAGMQRDLLDPIMLDILKKLTKEELEPMPEGLELKIVYQGRLALAMSSMQTNAIETVLAKWAAYDEKYYVFDNLNIDESFKLSAINTGVPANLFKDEEEVAKARQERNAPMQAQQDAMIMAEASKAYKNVTQAPQAGSLGEMM